LAFGKQAAQIGDLRDPVLAQQLANLYAVLHRVELIGVSLGARAAMNSPEFKRYLGALASCLQMSVVVDIRLRAQTEHIVDPLFEVVVGTDDAADRTFAAKVMEEFK